MYVDVDNVAGGREATRLLIERGATRIGTIAGPSDMTAAVDRLQGWQEAMAVAGLSSDAIVFGDFTEASGEAAARDLLARHPDLDGIAVASDLMAAGVLKVLAELGRRVPDDVAVVGYDDLGVAERTSPPLTTVRQSIDEMAERATRLLLEQLDSGASGAMRVVSLPCWCAAPCAPAPRVAPPVRPVAASLNHRRTSRRVGRTWVATP